MGRHSENATRRGARAADKRPSARHRAAGSGRGRWPGLVLLVSLGVAAIAAIAAFGATPTRPGARDDVAAASSEPRSTVTATEAADEPPVPPTSDSTSAPQPSVGLPSPATAADASPLASAEPAPSPAPPAPERPAAPAEVSPAWVNPVAMATLTSCFGQRAGSLHEGTDFAAPLGTPILAVSDGTVVAAGPAAGFGNWVAIQHANGDVTIYGHMRRYFVAVGQIVAAGQEIALVGNEGQSSGPHLHLAVALGSLNGRRVDPASWLRARGLELGID